MPAKKKTAVKKTARKATKKAAPSKTAKTAKKPAPQKSPKKAARTPAKKTTKKKAVRRKAESKRGLLISFEGSEGSGKTTQIGSVAEQFERAGLDVVVTREPGGTELGEEIRHLLMHAAAGESMTPETELLLFAASRAQLVREVIVPALQKGKIILCDRFLDSTTVYQGVGRQISAEPVHIINKFAVGDIVPDITVVIDVPAEIGLKRIKHRINDLPDRMESETIDFYRKVREGYLFLAQAMPERFIVVDGTKRTDVVARQIWNELSNRLA